MMRVIVILFLAHVFIFGLNAQDRFLNFEEEIDSFRIEFKTKFENHPNSPLKKEELEHLRFFSPDTNYVFNAEVKLSPEAKPFQMATYDGSSKLFQKYADLIFEFEGEKYQVAAYKNLRMQFLPSYKDKLFIPFKDATSGAETYGGGRYIDLKISSIVNNKIELDFNKTYNPWCHYSDGYSCPIPPTENHLAISILAGEKLMAKEKSNEK